MHELVSKWRSEAQQLATELAEDETGDASLASQMVILNRVAGELEKEWHERAHGAVWHPARCAICR